MAGGSPVPGINGGEYTTTEHVDAHGKPYTLKQGDLGSHALKKRPTGVPLRPTFLLILSPFRSRDKCPGEQVVWKSGGLANVSWYIAFVRTTTVCRHAIVQYRLTQKLLPTESRRGL